MKTPRLANLALFLLLSAAALRAADQFTVTVTNDPGIARPAEVITLPWREVARRFPNVLASHIVVKDAAGDVIPDQLLNFNPEEHRDNYLALIFQHDFAAGERTAVFTVGAVAEPVPPFPPKVAARYVPERFDDFGWENDRIAHRIYGPGLDSPAAGKTRMISSGIDVWAKRVRYLTNDRWYLMGHYHDDNGEGLDMYDVGTARGDGGTGIWDGRKLRVSQNWKTWKVLANGPVRAVFEISYAPWDAGNGVMVAETKRCTVDAGHNLDGVEDTYTFHNAADELTVAIGLGKHPKAVTSDLTKDTGGHWMTLWENYPKNGSIGCGVLLDPGCLADYAEEDVDWLMLAKVKSGRPLHYNIGACWSKSGDFTSKEDWNAYLAACAQREQSPVKVTFSAAP
jgi:hypothetical protein